MHIISKMLLLEKEQDAKWEQLKSKLLAFTNYGFLFNTVFQRLLY